MVQLPLPFSLVGVNYFHALGSRLVCHVLSNAKHFSPTYMVEWSRPEKLGFQAGCPSAQTSLKPQPGPAGAQRPKTARQPGCPVRSGQQPGRAWQPSGPARLAAWHDPAQPARPRPAQIGPAAQRPSPPSLAQKKMSKKMLF